MNYKHEYIYIYIRIKWASVNYKAVNRKLNDIHLPVYCWQVTSELDRGWDVIYSKWIVTMCEFEISYPFIGINFGDYSPQIIVSYILY